MDGADEVAVETLRALAEVQDLVDLRHSVLARNGNSRSSVRSHVLVRETPMQPPPHPPGARFGVWIAVALILAHADGPVTEWTCTAWHPPDDTGWKLERGVSLNESPYGEPVVLASTELPTVRLHDTKALAEAFPKLVGELLETPPPDPT
jgi:hypothetical protein